MLRAFYGLDFESALVYNSSEDIQATTTINKHHSSILVARQP